jgi:hypothetical protein
MRGELHTWEGSPNFQPHVHYHMPAGGHSPDVRSWVA